VPDPVSVRRVAHTGITVHDLEESIALWRDVLGFDLLGTADVEGSFLAELTGVPGPRLSAAVLSKGEHSIELLQYRAPDDRRQFRPRPVDVGSVHVALEVEDITAVVDACRAHGLVLSGSVVMGEGVVEGTRMAYLRTSDGVTLELLQPPT
jgi:catechol 2,3-dioxygenase-like lactoylglutathione lyase family enzyme